MLRYPSGSRSWLWTDGGAVAISESTSWRVILLPATIATVGPSVSGAPGFQTLAEPEPGREAAPVPAAGFGPPEHPTRNKAESERSASSGGAAARAERRLDRDRGIISGQPTLSQALPRPGKGEPAPRTRRAPSTARRAGCSSVPRRSPGP